MSSRSIRTLSFLMLKLSTKRRNALLAILPKTTLNLAITPGRQTKDILEELFDSGTVVYGLIVRAAIGKVFNVMFLGQIKGVNEFVEQTGGEIVGADKTEVDEKLGAVIDRLRARYAIGFRPTDTTDDGKFRKVEIKVVGAKKGKEPLIVLTKRG